MTTNVASIPGYYAVRRGKGGLKECIFVSWDTAKKYLDVEPNSANEVEFSFFAKIEDAVQYIHPNTAANSSTELSASSTTNSNGAASKTTTPTTAEKDDEAADAESKPGNKRKRLGVVEGTDKKTRGSENSDKEASKDKDTVSNNNNNNMKVDGAEEKPPESQSREGSNSNTEGQDSKDAKMEDAEGTKRPVAEALKSMKEETPSPSMVPINVILAQGFSQNLKKGWRSQHLGLYLNRRDHFKEPALKQYFQDLKELQKYLQFYSKPIRSTTEGKHISGASHPYCVFYLNWSWGVCNSYHRDIRRQQKKYMDQPYNQLEGIDLPLFKHFSKKDDKGKTASTPDSAAAKKKRESPANDVDSNGAGEESSESPTKEVVPTEATKTPIETPAKEGSSEGKEKSSDTPADNSDSKAPEKPSTAKDDSPKAADKAVPTSETKPKATTKPSPTDNSKPATTPTPPPLETVKEQPKSTPLSAILEEAYTNFRHRGWRAREMLPKANEDCDDEEEAEIHKTYLHKLKQKHFSTDMRKLEDFRETNPRELERPLHNKGRCQHPSGVKSPFEIEYLLYAWDMDDEEMKTMAREGKVGTTAEQRARQKRTLPTQTHTGVKPTGDVPSSDVPPAAAAPVADPTGPKSGKLPLKIGKDDETPPLIEALRSSWFQGREKGWRSVDMGLACGARGKTLSVGARKKREEFYLEDLEVLKQWWKSYPSSQHYIFTVPDEGEEEEAYKNMSYAASSNNRAGRSLDQKRHKSGINAPWSLTYLNWSWGVSNSYNRDLVRKEKRKAQYRKASAMMKEEEKKVASDQATLFI